VIDIADLELPDITAKALHGTQQQNDPGLERGNLSLDEFLNNIERKVITETLEACRWNKTAAAKELGITFRAMRYKLKKLGLE